MPTRDDGTEAPVSLQIRDMPFETASLIRRRARARGVTMAEYITRLVALHTAMLNSPFQAVPEAGALLAKHNLEEVRA